MGESVGDIIYIVVMVAALVVSMIIKAKKAPQDETPVPQSEMNERESDENFPTFSDWLSGGEGRPKEEIEVSPIPSQQSKNIPYEGMKSHLSASYHKAKQKEEIERSEGVSQTPPKSVPRRLAAIEEIESEASIWFKDPQDLRRAMIYSEILKRPSF